MEALKRRPEMLKQRSREAEWTCGTHGACLQEEWEAGVPLRSGGEGRLGVGGDERLGVGERKRVQKEK